MDSARRFETLGPYTLGQRLGLGGMAEVFEADCPEYGKVAVKRILPALAEDREFSDMFWDEARVTSRLDHPNVIKVLDYGRIDGQLFMALEYVDGPSAAKVLRRAANKREPLDPGVVVSIVTQLLDALAFVHEARDEKGRALQIVHRDVSPGNVLLSSAGHVKLGDFGIVRSELVMRRTQPGELKGKIGYMSPEQAVGGPLDTRSDLFSVGVILAEFLILRPLLLGKNEMQTLSRTVQADLTTWHRFNAQVPMPLRTIVERVLTRDIDSRFENAAAMRQALTDIAQLQGWDISPNSVKKAMVQLGFVERSTAASIGTDVSGERPVTRAGSQRRSSSTSTSGEVMMQPVGAPARYAGRPVWRVDFDRLSLPLQVMLATRRAHDGALELSTGNLSATVELRGGRIVAVHDSSGRAPLGRLLFDAGVIQKRDLVGAIGESRRAGLRLGEYLVMQRRVRESTLRRVLFEQTMIRLKPWFEVESGTLSVYLAEGHQLDEMYDHVPESLAQLISVLRHVMDSAALLRQLGPIYDSVLLPVPMPMDPAELGLTTQETRVLATTLHGGMFEGRSPRHVVDALSSERIARHREACFAIFIGLSAGLIQAPGFGRH